MRFGLLSIVGLAVVGCRGPRLSGLGDAGCLADGIELCDGVDNDCNGLVDDALGSAVCGVGACARTVSACVDGLVNLCAPGAPTAETCNGVDDDCDGQVDNGACRGPVVMCPASLTARAGTEVTLTATATATESPVSTTSWTVAAQPTGSSSNVSVTGATARFTPDVAGTFDLSFCATDAESRQTCCTTRLTTSACTSPPTPPISTACGTSWDGRPIVQFAPVPAGLTYELARQGDATVLATATAGHNHLRPATRIHPGAATPGASVQLEVRACRSDDAACCSTPAPLSVAVVSECTTVTAPTAADVVLSEYVVNGEGQCPSANCATQDTCQAGEAIELTNLSNCPISLDGFHFAYRNSSAAMGSMRWMNFGAADVIPPRGVYVAIRNRQFAPTCAASLGMERPGLFGLKISNLAMLGTSLCSGWFNNTGGGLSELQLASGVIAVGATPVFAPSAALARIAPYLPGSGSPMACSSIGFDAVDSCGSVRGGTAPTTGLTPNQLGRLWHPCDAVSSPVPACVRN